MADASRWHIAWDDGNQEDTFVLRPSEREINRFRMAAPDASAALYFSPNGWERETVQEWGPLRDEG